MPVESTGATDRAPALAEFLLSDESRTIRDSDGLLCECVTRWPGLTRGELSGGIVIARRSLRRGDAGHRAILHALDDLSDCCAKARS